MAEKTYHALLEELHFMRNYVAELHEHKLALELRVSELEAAVEVLSKAALRNNLQVEPCFTLDDPDQLMQRSFRVTFWINETVLVLKQDREIAAQHLARALTYEICRGLVRNHPGERRAVLAMSHKGGDG